VALRKFTETSSASDISQTLALRRISDLVALSSLWLFLGKMVAVGSFFGNDSIDHLTQNILGPDCSKTLQEWHYWKSTNLRFWSTTKTPSVIILPGRGTGALHQHLQRECR